MGVRGVPALRLLARRVQQVADVMPRDVQDGVLWAVKPLDRRVRREIDRVMPDGYAGTLNRSFRTQVTTNRGGVAVHGFARGRRDERDLDALDRGRLRHPRFGDREHWYAQTIRPGFWSRPAQQTADRVRRRIEQVLARLADRIGSEQR